MMDLAELSKELQPNGCRVIREEGFLLLSSITGATHRLLCASEAAIRGNAVWPSGFSYWIHEGQGLAFVGLWSGLLYQLGDAEHIIALCSRLCSVRHRTAFGPLIEIPREVAETYKMKEVEVLVLADPDAASLEDALRSNKQFPYSEREFAQRMEREVDSLVRDSAGNIQLELGDCRAFTKFSHAEGSRTTLSIVFHGGLRETVDHDRLLHALGRAFPLAMFDTSWGTRIDFADPYYGSPRHVLRPSNPINSWQQ